MANSIQDISLLNLSVAFIPMIVVLGIMFKWHMNYGNAIYATLRMVIQLLIIGYFLVFIFNTESSWIVLGDRTWRYQTTAKEIVCLYIDCNYYRWWDYAGNSESRCIGA